MNAKLLLLLILLVISYCASNVQGGAQIVRSFDAPGEESRGLAWDGEHLWNVDSGTDKIYEIDPVTGKILRELQTPGKVPVGITWGDDFLWIYNHPGYHDDPIYNLGAVVLKIDPNTGEFSKAFESKYLVQGLTWDGNDLWIVDDSKIRKVSKSGYSYPSKSFSIPKFPVRVISTGEIINTYYPQDIAWDGNFLWGTDAVADKIYKMSPETGEILEDYNVSSNGHRGPNGLTFDGKFLWASDSQKIYQIDISTKQTATPETTTPSPTVTPTDSQTSLPQTFSPTITPTPTQTNESKLQNLITWLKSNWYWFVMVLLGSGAFIITLREHLDKKKGKEKEWVAKIGKDLLVPIRDKVNMDKNHFIRIGSASFPQFIVWNFGTRTVNLQENLTIFAKKIYPIRWMLLSYYINGYDKICSETNRKIDELGKESRRKKITKSTYGNLGAEEVLDDAYEAEIEKILEAEGLNKRGKKKEREERYKILVEKKLESESLIEQIEDIKKQYPNKKADKLINKLNKLIEDMEIKYMLDINHPKYTKL